MIDELLFFLIEKVVGTEPGELNRCSIALH